MPVAGEQEDVALGVSGLQAFPGLSGLASSFCPCCLLSLPCPCPCARKGEVPAFLTFVPLKYHNVNIVLLI